VRAVRIFILRHKGEFRDVFASYSEASRETALVWQGYCEGCYVATK